MITANEVKPKPTIEAIAIIKNLILVDGADEQTLAIDLDRYISRLRGIHPKYTLAASRKNREVYIDLSKKTIKLKKCLEELTFAQRGKLFSGINTRFENNNQKERHWNDSTGIFEPQKNEVNELDNFNEYPTPSELHGILSYIEKCSELIASQLPVKELGGHPNKGPLDKRHYKLTILNPIYDKLGKLFYKASGDIGFANNENGSYGPFYDFLKSTFELVGAGDSPGNIGPEIVERSKSYTSNLIQKKLKNK